MRFFRVNDFCSKKGSARDEYIYTTKGKKVDHDFCAPSLCIFIFQLLLRIA